MWPFDSGETQQTMRLYEDMELRLNKLKAKSWLVLAPKSLFAWHRLREYQGQLRIFGKSKGYFLPLDQRSSVPISPYPLVHKETLDSITEPNGVALRSHAYALTENEAQQHKSRFYDIMGLAVLGMLIVTAALIFAKVTHKI